MHRIAFKRYKNTLDYQKDKLPDDLIVCYEVYNKHKTPWETALESDFNKELDKNITLIQEFINKSVAFNVSHQLSIMEVSSKQIKDNTAEFQLYLQFLDWKDELLKTQQELKAKEIKRLEDLRQGLNTDNTEIKYDHPRMVQKQKLNNNSGMKPRL